MNLDEFNEMVLKLKNLNSADEGGMTALFATKRIDLPVMDIKQRIELSTDPNEVETKKGVREFPVHLAKKDYSVEVEERKRLVNVADLIGPSWAFTDDRPDGKPISEKLSSLYLVEDPRQITLVPVYLCGDKYYTDDGNHRIYAAFLANRLLYVNVLGSIKIVE